jgi:acyl-CoA hydrolase
MRKSSRNRIVSAKQQELNNAKAQKFQNAEIAKKEKAKKEKEAENTRLEKIRLDKEAKDKADEDREYLNRVDKHLSELVKDVLKPAKRSETTYVKVKNVKN